MKRYFWTALLVFTAAAGAQMIVTIARFDKQFARISISGNGAGSLAGNLDGELEPYRRVNGILLDLQGFDPPDAVESLSEILARFTDDTLTLDTILLSPRGPWHYTDPLVIFADCTQTGIGFLRSFSRTRPFTEMELSADSRAAVKRLKQLAAEFRTQRQDRMDDLFHK